MAITAAALTKGGAAVALVGVGITGIYLTSAYSDNSISRYDMALIEFLSKDKNDSGWTWECSFKFEVENDADKSKPIQDKYKNNPI